MKKDMMIGVVLAFFFFFLVSLFIYEHYSSGFVDKNEKINKIVKHLGDKLTYQELKRRCPECDNVDYYRARKFI